MSNRKRRAITDWDFYRQLVVGSDPGELLYMQHDEIDRALEIIEFQKCCELLNLRNEYKPQPRLDTDLTENVDAPELVDGLPRKFFDEYGINIHKMRRKPMSNVKPLRYSRQLGAAITVEMMEWVDKMVKDMQLKNRSELVRIIIKKLMDDENKNIIKPLDKD